MLHKSWRKCLRAGMLALVCWGAINLYFRDADGGEEGYFNVGEMLRGRKIYVLRLVCREGMSSGDKGQIDILRSLSLFARYKH